VAGAVGNSRPARRAGHLGLAPPSCSRPPQPPLSDQATQAGAGELGLRRLAACHRVLICVMGTRRGGEDDPPLRRSTPRHATALEICSDSLIARTGRAAALTCRMC
jgi:hypothetical protein